LQSSDVKFKLVVVRISDTYKAMSEKKSAFSKHAYKIWLNQFSGISDE